MGFENNAVKIGRLTRLMLGYLGEASAREIRIDMSEWWDEFPGALVAIQMLRPYDRYKYFAAYETEDNTIYWTIDSGELKYAGKGLAQITLYDPDTKQEYKSRVVETIVAESIEEFNSLQLEDSDPASKWVNKTLEAAKSAEESKIAAKQSADDARQSASEAQEHAWTAQQWGEDVKFLSESAGSSSYQAQMAENSAKEAAGNAQTAATSATEAAEKAMTAIDSIRDNYPWDKNADLGQSRLGNKQPELMRSGIKNIRIYGADPKDELYLSRLGWWIGQEKYSAEISKGSEIVCYTTKERNEDDSGILQLPLEEYNGSGVRGYITIDLDALGEEFLFMFSHFVTQESMISELCYGAEDDRLDTILDKIAACEAAASAANTAATAANEAAVDVRAAADEISKTAAPAILPTATGDGVVVVNDSAARPLAGLRIYGKTTQDGTPSPDNPVPLVNIGADEGSIGVHARGANIIQCRCEKKEYGGVSFSPMGDGRIYVTGTALEERTIYYIVGEWEEKTGITLHKGNYYSITTTVKNVDAIAYGYNVQGKYSQILSGKLTDNYTDVSVYLQVGEGKTAKGYFTPTLTMDGWQTDYIPYQDGGHLAISTPNGLPGLPVTSGGNYTDETGQQWICDEIDLDKGVYIQHIKRLSGTWAMGNDANVSTGGQKWQDVATDFWGLEGGALCSSMPCVYDADAGWRSRQPTLSCSPDGNVRVYGTPGASYTLDILYALANPVETEIDDETLNAYAAMMSQKPTTTVYNDVGAGMAVDYIADTQTYIDNKFAALAAAVLDE